MKWFSRLMACAALFLTAALSIPANAQTYPYSTPTYIPTGVLPAQTFTATGVYDFVAQGQGGASVTISALTGTLSATIQGSNSPVSVSDASAVWATLNEIPAAGGAVQASMTANGTYLFSPAGFTRFRVNIGTLSGGGKTVTVSAAATPGAEEVYVMNQPGSSTPSTVNINQATPGTTNGVQVNAALPAGTNILGKVGIDQTTPGTTNGVQVNAALPAGTNNIGNTTSVQDYPLGATPLTASATGTTAATTATLAGVSGHTMYLCGFSIRANATAAATGTATVTGTITGTLSYVQWTAALASGIGTVEERFGPHCIPASGTNTSIAVQSAAPGSGGTVSVVADGYYQ